MKTSEEITYDRIKQLILDNHFPQGEFLSQRKLAAEVGATIVTLRSSLRLLENDGLIENVPKWGVRVPVETEASLKDRYYFREILEIGAVRKIREENPFKAREILLLKAKICDELWPNTENSAQAFAQAHMELHLAVADLSGNQYLSTELRRINFRSMMLSNAKSGWEIYHQIEIPDYHCDFIRRLFDGTTAEAETAVSEHIRRGRDAELKVLAQNNVLIQTA